MNLSSFKNVLFDIDGTLFDTKQFYSNFFNEIAQRYHIQLADVIHAKDNYFKTLKDRTDFNYQGFVIDIAHNLNLRIEDLKNFFLNEIEYMKCLYPDVVECISKLRTTHSLGIFSQGNKDYQMIKLAKTAILEYFDPQLLLIYDRKLTENSLNSIPPSSFIVEDKQEVVEILKNKEIDSIHLNRQKETDDIAQSISSLLELDH